MKKAIIFVVIAVLLVLYIIPDSMLGQYEGLRKAKYALRGGVSWTRAVVISLLKGEKPSEFDTVEQKAKEEIEQGKEELKEELKEEAKDTLIEAIDEL